MKWLARCLVTMKLNGCLKGDNEVARALEGDNEVARAEKGDNRSGSRAKS